MISEITLKNFKSIREAKLQLGPFNLFIGTNASGKSNFLDALRFLQGIGWGLSIDEIMNGRPRTGTGSEWEGIRGGSGMIEYLEAGKENKEARQVTLELALNLEYGYGWTPLRYGIEFNARAGHVRNEWRQGHFDTREATNNARSPVIKARYQSYSGPGRKAHLEFERHRPLLQQFAAHSDVESSGHKDAGEILSALSQIRRLDPQPSVLRMYSTAREVERMGERGENFAALVRAIRKGANEEAFLEWLRELRPEEVESIELLEGALKEPMFALKEKGRVFPAPALSDGTLRFAAIAAAFFQPDMPQVMTIEEIENGVNPARMRVLMELLRHRAGKATTQVIATTHSPLLLDWLTEDEWRHVFICHRSSESGATEIVPLTNIPGFAEAAKPGQIGVLFSEGWMDFAL